MGERFEPLRCSCAIEAKISQCRNRQKSMPVGLEAEGEYTRVEVCQYVHQSPSHHIGETLQATQSRRCLANKPLTNLTHESSLVS